MKLCKKLPEVPRVGRIVPSNLEEWGGERRVSGCGSSESCYILKVGNM
jgi:hypothetical protein